MEDSSTKRDDILTRPRGRPLKEKGNAAVDLQRARVRRAQKAFRERKERHVRALERKVSDLENVIERMSNTFMEFSDDLLKSGQIDPEQIKQTMEVFLALSKWASCSLDDESGASGDEQEQEDDMRKGESSSSKTVSNSGTAISRMAAPEDLSDYSSSAEVLTSLSPRQDHPSTAVTGNPNAVEQRVSDPYRNHLWGKPQNSSTDGTSALPYILAGRDSFASRLYFETMVMAVRALRGEEPRSIVDSFWRYKFRYVNFDHVFVVVSGVLNMMLHGTSQDPNEKRKAVRFSGLDWHEESAMKAAIAKEIALHGSSETEYLNTWSVERYLRDKWGLGVDSNTIRAPPWALEAHSDDFFSAPHYGRREHGFPRSPENPIPFAPTMVPGFPHSEPPLLDAQSLIEKIRLGAVSLGEGPRWHVSYIDNAVQSFLQDSRANLRIQTY